MEVGGIPYNIPNNVSYITSEASDGFDMLDLNQNERPMTVSVKNEKCDPLHNESDHLTVYDAEKQISKLNMHNVDDVFLQLTSQVQSQGKHFGFLKTKYFLTLSKLFKIILCYFFVRIFQKGV